MRQSTRPSRSGGSAPHAPRRGERTSAASTSGRPASARTPVPAPLGPSPFRPGPEARERRRSAVASLPSEGAAMTTDTISLPAHWQQRLARRSPGYLQRCCYWVPLVVVLAVQAALTMRIIPGALPPAGRGQVHIRRPRSSSMSSGRRRITPYETYFSGAPVISRRLAVADILAASPPSGCSAQSSFWPAPPGVL